MMITGFWRESWTAPLVNHLWQSSIMVAGAWLLALSLRRNHARVRYWVWLAASVKCLLPFSLLIAAGERLEALFATPAVLRPSLIALAQRIEQPLPQTQYFEVTNPVVRGHGLDWLPLLLSAAWLCGVLLVAVRWLRAWMRARAVLRKASPLEFALDVPVFSTNAPMEPGIFGVFRPVLLLPQGVLARLSHAQLDAIIAHEMCHVRRRDNLTYAVHMVVEMLFWFHPAVWWIGAQLIEERERACDEAVVRAGGNAETYAEGILNVCKFCVESPLACVAGVTGANLKKRIGHIMTGRVSWKLDRRRKALLIVAAFVTAAPPLALGAMHAMLNGTQSATDSAQSNSPAFEVASIKADKSEGQMMRAGLRITPDGVSISGVPLSMLVSQAFNLPDNQILNEPEWVKSARYDIEAKVDPSEASLLDKMTQQQRLAMMLPVLQSRFGLKFHHETKVLNVYTLVAAKGGPKLQPAKPDDTLGDAMPPAEPNGGGKPGDGGGPVNPPKGAMIMQISTQGMRLTGRGVTTAQLAGTMERVLGSTVVDKTGLTGKYDYTLSFAPEAGGMGPMGPMGPPPSGASASNDPAASTPATTAPSIFTAVQEQLGLKLVARKVPVDVIVIDHIEEPSPN
jgi:bla regulator protein blaR1